MICGRPTRNASVALAREGVTVTNDRFGGNEHEWPARLGDGATVRDWIADVLPGRQQVLGPLATMQAKEWGVTATFIATGATAVDTLEMSDALVPPARGQVARAPATPTEVVFKASWLPLFEAAPAVYAVLSRACPGMVPELLASQNRADAETWALFHAFAGTPIATLPRARRAAALAAMAQTLAHIQTAVAGLPAAELAALPRHEVADLPAQFELLMHDLRARMLPYWRGAQGRALARRYALPLDGLLERVEGYRAHVETWTAELVGGAWPTSLDHVDLHADNAVLTPGGAVLIYDWEEANLSLPFFSLDRLLDDARALDAPRGRQAASSYSPTVGPTERIVRDAYLQALPWQTLAQRERALDAALCLAPIKAAYEGLLFAQALGWPEGMPLVTAWAVDRALVRWETLAGAERSDARVC